ncbi:SgcJ/EcaC family oxidoreductase [Actinomadura flavalba]|uniref:SgcJ/EcaC family oxidoreductase n=1 Tax=Actinomadura flavalba TaxID=1120938 RepID=UPI00037BD35C|nr:SgcJ/EcaC family oxidoreductase [Actinomadura flavalba]
MNTTNLTPREIDDQRIGELVARSESAQFDADALPRLHTSDVVIVNIVGRRIFGRDTFSAAMRDALASPLKDVRTTLEIKDIRYAAPDVAVVSLVKTVHDERDDAQYAPQQTGAMTYVLVREAGDWRIAVAQTTPIP